MDRARLIIRLKEKEGIRYTSYRDSLGFWTVCVGHLLGSSAIYSGLTYTPAKCDCLLDKDISVAEQEAQAYGFYSNLDSPRQNVLVELTFNMAHKVDGFHKFLSAMERKDYAVAGLELKDSLAYKQEPRRFDELITALGSGDYPA